LIRSAARDFRKPFVSNFCAAIKRWIKIVLLVFFQIQRKVQRFQVHQHQ
jgi:hypothetical protein